MVHLQRPDAYGNTSRPTSKTWSGRNGVADLLSLVGSEVENIQQHVWDNSRQINQLQNTNAQLCIQNTQLHGENMHLREQIAHLQGGLLKLYASESSLKQDVKKLEAMLKVSEWQEDEELPKVSSKRTGEAVHD
ncbi:hypothetical protein BDV33DRAFT_210721 [Aspergillus novoparasiticus]|uniref:Uncharacterized protein n=1 Tax=Aspergillus novoparasiticus TaxID=986946 RepID=A0A5N6E5R9_9EURO|nr:hypothetical protein BDV33DRAFT_210721 [Aspergillus novoparasiticus]